jgi:hypothetical protein
MHSVANSAPQKVNSMREEVPVPSPEPAIGAFTPAAFGDKPATIAVLLQRKTAARPAGILAWADIFGEFPQARRHIRSVTRSDHRT